MESAPSPAGGRSGDTGAPVPPPRVRGEHPEGDYWVQEAYAKLETLLGDMTYFKCLRPDERVRVAQKFDLRLVAPGERESWTALERPRLGILVSGAVALELLDPVEGRAASFQASSGDSWNDLALFTGRNVPGEIEGRAFSVVAYLGREGLDEVLAEYPACAQPICERLALELKWKNDFLRSIRGLDPGWLGTWLYHFALQKKREHLRKRLGRMIRPTVQAAYRQAVRDRGKEPMFWVLIGFLLALVVSRSVVMFILKFNLQEKLFNLRPSEVGNPLHIHHFNYGFIVAFAAGLVAFSPLGRRILKTLSFVIGFGLGLVFDEFALILNLHPDYYQAESYYAAALVATLLLLVIYFRRFFAALLAKILPGGLGREE